MQSPHREELLPWLESFPIQLTTLLGTLRWSRWSLRASEDLRHNFLREPRALQKMPHPLWKEDRMLKHTWIWSQKHQEACSMSLYAWRSLSFYLLSELPFLIGWRKSKASPWGAGWVQRGVVGEEGKGTTKGMVVGRPCLLHINSIISKNWILDQRVLSPSITNSERGWKRIRRTGWGRRRQGCTSSEFCRQDPPEIDLTLPQT